VRTLVLNINDDKFDFILSVINSFKDGIIESMEVKNKSIDLDIEVVEKDSDDFKEIQKIKAEKNQKYSINETRKLLGLD
jgi:hypothetical protein